MTRVLAWPHWTGNPYLPRFAAELERAGVRVRGSVTLAGGAARLRPGDWLHLHWPGARLISRWRPIYALRVRAFERRLRLLAARGVRIAWTAHNLYPHDDPHPDLGRRAREILCAAVDHVFVHFPGAVESLAREFGHCGPITEIPHGHYIDDYGEPPPRAAARAALGLPTGGQVALLFGQLRRYKGIREAVSGFLSVARADDRLIVAGRPEGDVRDELAAARRDPRVIVIDRHVPRADVPVLYSAADVALLAHTRFFTSGSAVLALSMGAPILGPPEHHLAALPNLIAQPPGAAGLAAALVHARTAHVDRASFRSWARRELSWSTAAARAAAVFLDLDDYFSGPNPPVVEPGDEPPKPTPRTNRSSRSETVRSKASGGTPK